MTGFVAKTINDRSLGDELRERRTALGQSLEDVERATHVSKKYLTAIETNDLSKLPDLVYARSFVRALAKHYGLDPDAYAKSLVQELSVATPRAFRHPGAFVQGKTLMVTPRIFKAALLSAAFLAIAAYFAYSVHRILKPPFLEIGSPKDDQVFATMQVLLEGRTEPEVELTVNGEPVAVESDGVFADLLDLPAGVSNLRIAARKKHSREHEVFLRVVVEPPPIAPESATGTGAASTVDDPAER